MRTERVTYLTSAEQKAALEAFAKARGESVGSVLREATLTYMAEVPLNDEDKLDILVAELNVALPAIEASFERMTKKLDAAHAELAQLRTARKAAV
jgi:signal transduction protein with GAF and PtsI domain